MDGAAGGSSGGSMIVLGGGVTIGGGVEDGGEGSVSGGDSTGGVDGGGLAGGAAAIAMVSNTEAEPPAFDAVIVTVAVPAAGGVPVSVRASSASQLGPLAIMISVGAPPEKLSGRLNGTPAIAAAFAYVVMTGAAGGGGAGGAMRTPDVSGAKTQ
jgi:hypothetical protein